MMKCKMKVYSLLAAGLFIICACVFMSMERNIPKCYEVYFIHAYVLGKGVRVLDLNEQGMYIREIAPPKDFHGVWRIWYKNGALREKRAYNSHGQLIKVDHWSSNGTLLLSDSYDDKGKLTKRFSNYKKPNYTSLYPVPLEE